MPVTTTPHEYKEKIGECRACGNSPVHHTSMFVMQTINVWMGIVVKKLSTSHFYVSFSRAIRISMQRLDRLTYRIAYVLGAVRFAHNPDAAYSYRSQVVWEEAVARGITMEQVMFFGKLTDTYRARVHGSWIYFESLPIPPELSQEAFNWIDDKFLLKTVLSAHDISVPKTRSVSSEAQLKEAFAVIGGTVTIKPRAGSRGRHTTTNVSTLADAIKAFNSARKLCYYVSIEEHLTGSVCRATVVNGSLAGFFQADPPKVTGDGVHTIRELVEKKNAHKHERVQNVELNEDHSDFIARMGLTFDSVLDDGRQIDLTHRTGRLFGGETREILTTVHPHLKVELERAASVLDVPIVGFDLISKYPTQDPAGQRWGIIEANTLPFIDLHYLPLYGEPSKVAGAVWDLWK